MKIVDGYLFNGHTKKWTKNLQKYPKERELIKKRFYISQDMEDYNQNRPKITEKCSPAEGYML